MLSKEMLEALYQKEAVDGDDDGFRNYRVDAFFWWLDRKLTPVQIKKLYRLTFYEKPGKHLRSSINRHPDCTEPLRKALFGYTRREIPNFSKQRLAELLQFPKEWLEWDMYPDTLFLEHRKQFQPGNESSSENERNEVFHYWLARDLTEVQILKLVQLARLDPDPLMGEDVARHILKHKNCPPQVKQVLQKT